ncbi:MAG: hypothetical protein GAK30_03476 [Paracidovorax wautersii]|uniref:Metallo-beta-lactamase domain-containing protein n=1 Tax=Paracidovorax wautersii TaxID=1177982 RepID=A0A7V8FL62_9BURK|nr:MAG: hypothetical protein GAK30_03476 [Paracidovorax wautersii]
MKIRWRWLFLALATVAATLVAGVLIFLRQPVFGQLPQGDRLARIAHSPNHANGIFHNQIDTPLRTTDQSEWAMWMQNLFGEQQGHPRPSGPIPALKTDLKALDAGQDLVVWLGHSSYYVQLAGRRILIDPVFSVNAAPIPGANVAFEGTSLYSAQDMPDIDALLISHDHYDHLDYPTVTALRDKVAMVIVGLGVGAHFERWGYDLDKVREADWHEAVTLPGDLTVHVTPARHFSGRTLDRDQSLWAGFALVSPARRLFFSGDSGYGPHFADIGQRYGPFDWIALDTGQYDPRWANVHMNHEQAAQAAQDLQTRAFTPGHIGRFSIAPHDWDDPFKRIAAASQGHAYALWTPLIGQPVLFDDGAKAFTAWWEGLQ